MRRHIVRVGTLVTSFAILALASGWGSEVGRVEPAEADTPLFDHQTVRHADSRILRTTASVDLGQTLNRWEGAARRGVADRAAARRLIRGLVVLSAVAFQDPDFQSTSEDSSTNICSTSNGPPNEGPAGCSTARGEGETADECSARSPDDESPESASCSANGTISTNTTCSVNTPPEPATDQDNTTCSSGSAGSQSYCSAGIQGVTQSCSTGGGQSQIGTSNGAAACSAGSAGTNPDPFSCSTNGNSAGQSCSTYAGQHQSCSSGFTTNPTDQVYCSTSGGANAGTCSVSEAPPISDDEDPVYGNQCSAIATGAPPDNGSATCSTKSAGGTCSVSASDTQNAQCTTFGTPTSPTGHLGCSAQLGSNVPNTQCSVLNSSGGFVSEPDPLTGQCGDGYRGHEF